MQNTRPEFDQVIQAIAYYTLNFSSPSELAMNTAYYNFLDTIACGLMALAYSACTKLLGPIVPGATLEKGTRVPGTEYVLEPVQGAFNIGTIIRWLDFNDTWLAAEWGHPSDNWGGILAIADYLQRNKKAKFTLHDLYLAIIKAHEIQGCLALENSFNRMGLDHVILVKVATTAVVSQMLGADFSRICNAISLAFVDGQSLRTYRHAPNTGSRKSWAAGDATSRGVRLALMAMSGEMGYPSALSAKTWGFYDVYANGQPFKFQRDYGCYVMENVLFKISFPAEFHAQTAVEAAIQLHPQIKDRLDDIKTIHVRTHESCLRIINKTGPLHNPADRDHCIQYMVAIGLLFSNLTAEHYEDDVAKDPRIDGLREKMHLQEDKQFTKDYLDPDKRSIANALQVTFNDGSQTEEVIVEYPIGHRRRREEGFPLILEKFTNAVNMHFDSTHAPKILDVFLDPQKLSTMAIDEVMGHLVTHITH